MDEDELASIAQQLVGRVRDDDPTANGKWLLAETTEEDRWRLLFVLAAAVPDDRTWAQLTAWARGNEPELSTLMPCGTRAAAERHRRRKERICLACREAERARRKKPAA